ncbi:MAG: beta-ketoacyl-[acyl-carrier-protein] synthase family protein [Prevotellaceae bacterium]|jgi:3-oxoacyl-[acyl-carrier-protein] synthase-1|nr:beta-ketoacyl-[acyl-carrier-protein] synthase family protein [Prevotellaceae bacterium]
MSKILVSGMGIISAIGNNVVETLQSLRENRSGIEHLRYLKTAHNKFPVGEIKLSNEEMMRMLNIPENLPVTRTSLMGMLAVHEALISACYCWRNQQLSDKQKVAALFKMTDKRIALINGTTVGGMDKREQFYKDFLENDSKNDYIKSHDCGTCTEMIADYFGIFSQLQTISTACSSAANSILYGAELLKNDKADIVVVGGSECITKFHLNGFKMLMILDREKCRPFDITRAGLNLGEGAAYLVLEKEEHFRKRTALSPLAELKGYANTCDAYHQTASSPEGDGAFLAMKKALENANLSLSDIDYINAHGTATQNNDLSEGTAIQRLFGDNIPPVSSTKTFTGHTTSAAGSVEAVISILALQNNFVPANLGYKKKMQELNFEPFTNSHKTLKPVRVVLSNSFGFGGNNTTLIFSKL